MPSFSTNEFVAAAEFRSALRMFERMTEEAARSAGLTPQRYLLLLMIKGAPDHSCRSTVTDLAGRLRLAQSTVTELVRRAEDAGLVERETAPNDQRVSHLRVTREGERRLSSVIHELSSKRRELQAAFDHADRLR